LGKEGILIVNAIGSLSDLNKSNLDLDQILASVNFMEGNKHSAYTEGINKKASYGIAGLNWNYG